MEENKSIWWVEYKLMFGNQLNELIAVEADSRDSAIKKAEYWISRNKSANFNILVVHNKLPNQINNYLVAKDYAKPLTVAELIELLKQFNPDSPVLLADDFFNSMSYGPLSKSNIFGDSVESAVFTDFDGHSNIRYDNFGDIECVVIGYEIDD